MEEEEEWTYKICKGGKKRITIGWFGKMGVWAEVQENSRSEM